jgi:hypothetical protein
VKKRRAPVITWAYVSFPQEFHRNSTFSKKDKMSKSYILKRGLSKRSDNLYYVTFGGFPMWKAYCLVVLAWSWTILLIILFILFLFFGSSYITPSAYGFVKGSYVNCSFLNNIRTPIRGPPL